MNAPNSDGQDAQDMARLVDGGDAALNDLMERHAEKLFHYEGRSQAEIGEILGCSVKAVETRIYRARQQLRVGLGKLMDTV
jgi:RNA polymerase sigma-70 factor (ECF subfamily)